MIKNRLVQIFLMVTMSLGSSLIFGQNSIELSQLKDIRVGEDATPLIREAFDRCKDGETILIPPGVYHMKPELAAEHYCIISNHDNGMVRIGFHIEGKTGITVDGQGALFVFEGDMIPFNLVNSKNITLKNFSFDWKRPFHSQGEVIAVDSANKTFDIGISDEYPYRIEKNELIWLREKNQNPWNRQLWTQDVQINIFFDRKTNATAYRVKEHKLNPYYPLLRTQYLAKEIETGKVRIVDTIAKLPQTGWVWVSKGGLRPVRLAPGIRILSCKNVRIENVNIHHAGGMGIIGERSEDISLKKVNVVLPPGNKDRVVTTTADATHFVNCRGLISIDSCLFENMLDDATNIHGSYLKLAGIIDEHTIAAIAPHHEQNVNLWCAPGDTLKFWDNQTMEAYQNQIVTGFKFINRYYALIQVSGTTKGLKQNSGIENINWYPEFRMTNCIVRNNRARSILLSSNRSMLIENNRFIKPMMAAISISGDMNYWFESGNVTDLVIRNNYFENVSTGGFDQAVISIEPNMLYPDRVQKSFHNRIQIENNHFKTFDKRILFASFVDDLVFKNNVVEKTQDYVSLFPDKSAIDLKQVVDARIEGNVFPKNEKYKLLNDSKSKNIKVSNNKNLIFEK